MTAKKTKTAFLKEALLPDLFERGIVKAYKQKVGDQYHFIEPDILNLNLKSVEFIDVSALSCLIALMRSRSLSDKVTKILLPEKPAVLKFLKLWRFFEAIESVLEKPIQEFFFQNDLMEIHKPLPKYPAMHSGVEVLEYNKNWHQGYPGRRNFFELIPFDILSNGNGNKTYRKEAIPRTEGTRWQGELIKAVLSKHLSGGREEEDEVSRIIIFESLANSIQHPQARKMLTSSIFGKKVREKGYRSGHLTICVWDDGESIIKTLGKVIKSGGQLRSFNLPLAMYDRIELKVKDLSGKNLYEDIIKTAQDPPIDSPDEKILLCSIFPGITRRIHTPVKEVETLSECRPTDILANRMGMGLYTLTRTVLDLYGGDLILRCGSCFLSLKIAHDSIRKPKKVHYKATITKFPDGFPEFKGNLLVMRIPIPKPEK